MVDFKPKLVRRDKEGHFLLIKAAVHQGEIATGNLYVPIVSEPNLIKHTLLDLKTQIDPNTVGVGDFNTVSPIDLLSRQKINKETRELNDAIDQMDLTDVYRAFHLVTAQYTFFSAAHGTFSEIDHILGHKESLNKYKKTEVTPCIPSDHNTIKIRTEQQKKQQKILKHMETEQHIAL
jgi:exonuclease III